MKRNPWQPDSIQQLLYLLDLENDLHTEFMLLRDFVPINKIKTLICGGPSNCGGPVQLHSLHMLKFDTGLPLNVLQSFSIK